jgi:hypothetical protein
MLVEASSTPSGDPDTVPFSLDREAREQELRHAGFELALYAESHWPLRLVSENVRKLYSGFSGIARLDESTRTRTLDVLMANVNGRFGGEVTRNLTSLLYLFRKPGALTA